MCKKLIYLVCFVLVLGLTTTVANADIADGLVGYWPLNEGEGTTTSDLSGNGNDGTINGGPIWADGKFGGALDFDGSDDYVDCGNSTILDFGTGDFTISAWIKMTSTERGTIWAKGGDDSGGIRYTLSMGESNDNRITMLVDDNSTKIRAEGATLVTDGVWHHVVGMREGTTLRTCVDGIYEDGINDLPSTGYDISGTSQKNALIGAIWSQGDNVIKKFFAGLIDDVALWNRALTPEEISYLWNGGAGNPVDVSDPGQASDPVPADKEADVLRDVVLSWTPGDFAPAVNGHIVYLSENFNDVNDGIGGIAQDATSYAPDPRLDFGTTYYWRVDEVNGPPDNTVYEGEVWNFTTEPIGYPIEDITATASSTHQAEMGAENTINGSGLDDNDLHSNEPTDMWLSSNEPLGAWIKYEFDKVYKLHEMWVWNSNQMIEPLIGFGFKDVTIEYSANGTDYTTLGTTHEFAQAPGAAAGYTHNTTVDFGGAAAKHVKLTANSNWGILPQYGLSEVRFFYVPVWAREPSPDSGATDVAVDVVLGWRAGREAAQHDVYVSTDEQVVIDGTAPVATVTETSYGPLSLDLGMIYYWKINEVNMAETPTTLDGDVWNFTTPDFLVVDDFELYNDLDIGETGSNRIYLAWIDGWDVPANGSQAGYTEPPFAEQTIVHGGAQSMPLLYNNTGTATYSEAERTFAAAQDWTKAGIATLVLHFRGTEGNTGQIYVKINGSKVVYDGDAADTATLQWKQWNINLASVGTNPQNVTTLSIGIDGIGASGTLYVDDIRLSASAPEPEAP